MKTSPQAKNLLFLKGGGKVGNIIKTMEWDKSSLGDLKTWPISFRTALGMLLHSNIPMLLFWGDELKCFYNDAFMQYRNIAGRQHLLGKNGMEIWPELWDIIGLSVIEVYHTAQPISLNDRPVA